MLAQQHKQTYRHTNLFTQNILYIYIYIYKVFYNVQKNVAFPVICCN